MVSSFYRLWEWMAKDVKWVIKWDKSLYKDTHYMNVGWTISWIVGSMVYWINKFNNANDERIEAQKYDSNPNRPKLILWFKKDNDWKIVYKDDRPVIESIDLNVIPWQMMSLWNWNDKLFNSVRSEVGKDNFEKTIDNLFVNKSLSDELRSSFLGQDNSGTDGLSRMIPILNAVTQYTKDYSYQPTNYKTTAVSKFLADWRNSQIWDTWVHVTPKNFDRAFDAIFATRSNDVKNLIAYWLEKFWVDLSKNAKEIWWDTWIYSKDTEFHKYFGQENWAKWLGNFLLDFTKMPKKESVWFDTVSKDIRKETNIYQTNKTIEDQMNKDRLIRNLDMKWKEWQPFPYNEMKWELSSTFKTEREAFTFIKQYLLDERGDTISKMTSDQIQNVIIDKLWSNDEKKEMIIDLVKRKILSEEKASKIVDNLWIGYLFKKISK